MPLSRFILPVFFQEVRHGDPGKTRSGKRLHGAGRQKSSSLNTPTGLITPDSESHFADGQQGTVKFALATDGNVRAVFTM